MEQLIDQLSPREAIHAALSGMQFLRELPPEITAAMKAGIVDAGDDQWMRSDDPHRINYIVLTPAGRRLATRLGLLTEETEVPAPQRQLSPLPETDHAVPALFQDPALTGVS